MEADWWKDLSYRHIKGRVVGKNIQHINVYSSEIDKYFFLRSGTGATVGSATVGSTTVGSSVL